jgi:flagellar biosynthesis component FlhA
VLKVYSLFSHLPSFPFCLLSLILFGAEEQANACAKAEDAAEEARKAKEAAKDAAVAEEASEAMEADKEVSMAMEAVKGEATAGARGRAGNEVKESLKKEKIKGFHYLSQDINI